jgi:hypothetical protein
MSSGLKGHIGYAPSATFPDSMYFLPFISESLTETKEELISNNITGIWDEGDSIEGVKEATGDIVIEPTPIHLNRFIALLGAVQTEVQSNDIYTRSYILNQGGSYNSHASNFSLNVYRDDLNSGFDAYRSHEMLYCALNSINFEFNHGALPLVTMNVMPWYSTQVESVYTASYDSDDKEYSWASNSASISGTGTSGLRSLSITVTNNYENIRTIGTDILTGQSGEVQFQYRNAARTVDVSGTIVTYDYDVHSSFVNYETIPIKYYIPGTEIASGYTGSLLIDMPSVQITEFSQNISGPGIIETSFTGKAKYNAGSGTAIEFTIQNTAVY